MIINLHKTKNGDYIDLPLVDHRNDSITLLMETRDNGVLRFSDDGFLMADCYCLYEQQMTKEEFAVEILTYLKRSLTNIRMENNDGIISFVHDTANLNLEEPLWAGSCILFGQLIAKAHQHFWEKAQNYD